jgi:acetoin utilization deacetylase AcuC-like enzyme
MDIFYSDKYWKGITHLDAIGTKEYFLDAVIKPKWVYDSLKESKFGNIIEGNLISGSDILKIHSSEYVQAVKTGNPSELAKSSGLRWMPDLYDSYLYKVSGLYSACLNALENKVSATLATGFHHAKEEKGSGFCVFNGAVIAAQKLIDENKIQKILILDTDVHHADGTASLISDSKNIFLFDIFKYFHKPNISSVGNGFKSFLSGGNIFTNKAQNKNEFFQILNKLESILGEIKPDLIIYDAGLDGHYQDRCGGYPDMKEGDFINRDKIVFELAKNNSIPIAFYHGGAYIDRTGKSENEIETQRELITKMHVNTFYVAKNIF